ncbi:spondin domain-containing protein [Moritella marina]|uniref:spondin domain-containing protein n=1 Tax=Moritella marina TaxID=90736 RepID=UPI0037045A86
MRRLLIPLVLITLFLSACDDSNTSSNTNITPQDDVVYELTFTSNWNSVNFPTNYPSSAHFSGLIGLTHNNQIDIFKRSELATLGIITVAETGGKSVLIDEINAHIATADSDKAIDGGGIPAGSSTVSVTFSANTNHPYLSIVSMVAPSPDWFIGIDSFNLYKNGQWQDNAKFNLNVYDAGSDSADTFTAADSPQTPKNVITLLTTDSADTDFLAGVHRDNGTFIGTITLKIITRN